MCDELDSKVSKLYQQGKYSDAIKVAKEALEVAKRTFGPDHPDVATVLENVSELYKKIGKEDEAERLEERVKIIRSSQSSDT